jgi:hypothetical protein
MPLAMDIILGAEFTVDTAVDAQRSAALLVMQYGKTVEERREFLDMLGLQL